MTNIRTLPRTALIDLLTVPGVQVTHCRWLRWEIAATGHTQRLSRIHNQLLRQKLAGAQS